MSGALIRIGRRAAVSLLIGPVLAQAGAVSPWGPPVWQSPVVESVGLRQLTEFHKFDGATQSAFQVALRGGPVSQVEGLRWNWLLAAGALARRSAGDGANFYSVGVELHQRLSLSGLNAVVAAGLSPTVLSEDVLGPRHLGGDFHFTSHLYVGLPLDARRRYLLGYRVQHLSNGGLRADNPGADFAGVELRMQLLR